MPQPIPSYLVPQPDGGYAVDMEAAWTFTPKQMEMVDSHAPMYLSVGGIRSGKTASAIMKGVLHYLLRFPGCNMLVLRRTFAELKSGPLEDFRTHVPKEIYTYNGTDHIATFTVNGSKAVFGHCQNLRERDIEQYLGSAYPFILVDECAQFSQDAWELLYSRNTVNPECRPCEDPNDPAYGLLPVPQMVGCTNPVGHHWPYYKTVFVLGEPSPKPEGCRKDRNGRYWVGYRTGDPVCAYEPSQYGWQHSTVLDNPHALRRDPGLIARLQSMPDMKRRKFLLGELDSSEDVYYDCWDEERHVVNLRADPDAIVWEPWQPVWAGQDWAIGGHWNTMFFYTLALVRKSVGGDYVRKTVLWKEVVTQNKTAREMAELLRSTLKAPWDGQFPHLRAIYFSHEKFVRQTEEHSPADIVSQEYRKVGLPPVTAGTQNRIGRASLLYMKLKHGELVALDSCREFIRSIPVVPRDKDRLDDVLKAAGASKVDDVYDGSSLGLYGYFGPRNQSADDVADSRARELKEKDPFAARLAMYKTYADSRARLERPGGRPAWYSRAQATKP